MSAVAHPSTLTGPRNGGVAARRAVTRWARRMFRREWRQQLLVVTLLTVAVAAAIGSITLVYNTSSAVNSEFGSANTVLEFDGTDPRKLEAGLATAKKSFGTTDVIGHRSVAVPGSVDKVDFRAQDPNGAYGGELLALRRGRYPEGRGEVAVTDGVAKLLRLDLGSTLALDGVRRTVVGIVENPRKLSDEFALVSPSFASAPDHVSVLVDANDASLRSFYDSIDQDRSGFAGMMRIGNDGPPDTLAMFSVATVFLLLASLIAAAGFAVIAQRRLRHLGMLAAIGATQKHLRLVLIANGAIVGAIAALCGTLVGLALWVAVRPDARVCCRPSRRPAQPSVAADRADRPPRTLRGDRRRLVARANGRSAPRHARALGAAAQAEARTPLGDRGCRADRGRHRLSRTVEPRQAAAHRRRDRGDDRRLPAPRPAGDPRLLRPRWASLDRTPIGTPRPRSLSGPFRSGARRSHPRPRHRSDGRHHRLCRGGEESGRAGQPVRPTDAGLPRPTGRSGAHPDGRTRSARTPDRRASGGSPPNSTGQP